MIALVAAVIGSVAAAITYGSAVTVMDHGAALEIVPLGLLLITLVALIVAIPASLVIGAPLLWATQHLVLRWPLAGTVSLALAGMASAIPINGWMNSGNAEQDPRLAMLFGGFVAGAHGIVLVQRTRRNWWQTLALTTSSVGLAGLLGLLMEGEYRNQRAARSFANACEHYDFASHIAAPDRLAMALQPAGHRLTFEQEHWTLSNNAALFARYSAVFVDGIRTLVAEDQALVPLRPWHRLGAERTVTAQCLMMLKGQDAASVRRAGLIRPFRWAEVDPASR